MLSTLDAGTEEKAQWKSNTNNKAGRKDLFIKLVYSVAAKLLDKNNIKKRFRDNFKRNNL
jgi:hypothetical protein